MDKNIGRVFSIEEFSVYDGPGIRTTVFLKGCPLQCEWCHNPEGRIYEKQEVHDPRTGKLLRISGTDYTVDELVTKLLKNAKVLNMNGGGVTFSGGEPLYQPEFLNKVLIRLKGKVHIAIQTSGYATQEVFEETLKNVDLVLFDLKIMDNELAQKFQKADNRVIFNNLEVLKKTKVPFIARVPLIPELTDTDANLSQIAELLADAKNLMMVEILPYNKMAGAKHRMLGKKYEPHFDENKELNLNIEILTRKGFKVKVN
ncbi:MAG: 4-hydroxyphenylacetate decarboxylase activating enzyme [Tenericutes bacterium ADurb.Bin239]|nr:MAG: 4-hydroxyphenylacetate decarboxylase activating enzyme [Tenericutes bacterium ADurb.Bin239]